MMVLSITDRFAFCSLTTFVLILSFLLAVTAQPPASRSSGAPSLNAWRSIQTANTRTSSGQVTDWDLWKHHRLPQSLDPWPSDQELDTLLMGHMHRNIWHPVEIGQNLDPENRYRVKQYPVLKYGEFDRIVFDVAANRHRYLYIYKDEREPIIEFVRISGRRRTSRTRWEVNLLQNDAFIAEKMNHAARLEREWGKVIRQLVHGRPIRQDRYRSALESGDIPTVTVRDATNLGVLRHLLLTHGHLNLQPTMLGNVLAIDPPLQLELEDTGRVKIADGFEQIPLETLGHWNVRP